MKATLPDGTQLEGTQEEITHVLQALGYFHLQSPVYVPTPWYIEPTPFVPTFEVHWGDHDLPATTTTIQKLEAKREAQQADARDWLANR